MRLGCFIQGLRNIILDKIVQAVIELGSRFRSKPLFINRAIDRKADRRLFISKIIHTGAEGVTAIGISSISMLNGIPVKGSTGLVPETVVGMDVIEPLPISIPVIAIDIHLPLAPVEVQAIRAFEISGYDGGGSQ